ncbi:serine O-acetyltransferase [Haloprofundus marisrubri]|uniref:serine O-acetyltransferase n=1 Tax=Haloprofundus marisrubri TaxID=1514971 RepID=UPI0009E51516|nr:serine O-acetyltransferase [Haloprofundus marisrubri]
MPSPWTRLREDLRAALENDPAALSRTEVLLTYPGVHALWIHRIAHTLWNGGMHLPARLLSHLARFLTGVEIHPAATVGRRVFIDHGMGVVVGETAEIGDDVVLYHGVTLGGKSMQRTKRHPTVEGGAVVGANATLIGPLTVGENARVGAGSVVVDDVPADAVVVGNPARPPGETSKAESGDGSDTSDDDASDPGETDESVDAGDADGAVGR